MIGFAIALTLSANFSWSATPGDPACEISALQFAGAADLDMDFVTAHGVSGSLTTIEAAQASVLIVRRIIDQGTYLRFINGSGQTVASGTHEDALACAYLAMRGSRECTSQGPEATHARNHIRSLLAGSGSDAELREHYVSAIMTKTALTRDELSDLGSLDLRVYQVVLLLLESGIGARVAVDRGREAGRQVLLPWETCFPAPGTTTAISIDWPTLLHILRMKGREESTVDRFWQDLSLERAISVSRLVAGYGISWEEIDRVARSILATSGYQTLVRTPLTYIVRVADEIRRGTRSGERVRGYDS